MHMSIEVIGTLIALVGAAGMLFGGLYMLMQRQTAQLASMISQSDARNDARFDRVDVRFDKIDGHFERRDSKIDERFDRFEQRFESVDDRFERIVAEFDAKIDTRFRAVDDRFTTVDERFEKLDSKIDVKFDLLHDELRSITENVIEVKVSVARLEGPLPTLIRARRVSHRSVFAADSGRGSPSVSLCRGEMR